MAIFTRCWNTIIINLVVGKQRANRALDRSYDYTPKSSLKIEGRVVKKGDRVKVLAKRGTRVRIRDDRGNEAEVEEDALEAR